MSRARTPLPLSSAALLALLLAPLAACDAPTGPDLAVFSCLCEDEAFGDQILIAPARACTDLDDEQKASADAQSVCDSKETLCFPDCIGIENCGVFDEPIQEGMCPGGSSPNAGGDFGQTLSRAAVGSLLSISGGDVDDFGVVPDELEVSTTQLGSELEFADIAGRVDEVTFSTPGGFLGIGGGSHTLRDARLYLVSPFSVPLAADGDFTIPEGAGELIVTGRLDGDPAPLGAMTRLLTGVYDEEAGLFELSGRIDADGADVRIDLDIPFDFVNRPPRARAGDDQSVECSSTDETGVAVVSGAASFDLDGEEDIVRYAWTVDLGVPDPVVVEGREAFIPLSLGSHVLTLSVADRRGSFQVDSLDVLVEDTEPPALVIASPEPIQYPHSAALTLDFTADDACIGTASSLARLDGLGPLVDGQTIDLLTELSLGSHTFSLEARDSLGNEDMRSVVFEVVVTFQSLRDAVERFRASGRIASAGVAEALLRQLAAAEARDDCGAAARVLSAFERTVRAQSGRQIDPTAAEILGSDARALAESCS